MTIEFDEELFLLMKKKYSSFPRLPKFILLKNTEGYKKPSKALMDSIMAGFNKRLGNWLRDEDHESILYHEADRLKRKRERLSKEAND